MKTLQKILYALGLFKKAFGGYKWHIAILAVIGFLSGLLEGIGVNALIPLFSFITGEGGATDFISRAIERGFAIVGIDFSLTHILIFIAVLFVLKAIILFIGAYIQLRIMVDYQKNTRMEIFKKAMRAEWQRLLRQKIGHLEKLVSVEVGYVSSLLTTASSLVLVLTSLIVFLAVAINISFTVTLVALGVGFFVLILFHPLVRKIRDVSKQAAAKARELSHFVNENILGMKTVKTMSVDTPVFVRGELLFEATRLLQVRRSLLKNIFGSFFQPFSVIFILLLFAFSYKTGNFNLPAFVALIYLIQRIFSQVQGLQAHMQTIWDMMPYLEHVLEYKNEMDAWKEEDRGVLPFAFQKNFLFKNVSFGYGGGKEVLSNISFSIPKGSFVGLIGPSGAGKTTMVDLLLRLFKPTEGNILLDDVPIADINLQEYRKNIGYVSQDIHLINETVANNIRFFDDTIPNETVMRAAKDAQIFDTIQALPKKFDTVVGERGVLFSAGQRQRIVIARVLARNPQFLILDEATSALDNESEKRIQEVIANLKGKATVLVIAHRLGTVMTCDELMVLDGGKIVEKGKPHELLKDKESYFFKMYNIRE